MEKIISELLAIQRYAKQVHYDCAGENFYADHLLADLVFEDIESFMDEINEVFYLGRDIKQPEQEFVLANAGSIIAEADGDYFKKLHSLLVMCLTDVEMYQNENDLTAGETDVLGRISSNLQKKNGLILRRLK